MAYDSLVSGTKMYFYQNVAPAHWTIDSTPADALLAVKGGSNAFNVDGGNQAGTWTQLNHTHTGPSHTHTGPSHTHSVPKDGWGHAGAWASGRVSTYGGIDGLLTRSAVNGVTSGTSGTGASGAGGTGATGGGTSAATYRPLAQVGIIATKD